MSIFGGGSGGIPSTPAGVNLSDPNAVLEYGSMRYISSNLPKNLGSPMLAWLFDFLMFGIFAHQLLVWSSNMHTDRKIIRYIVAWISLISLGTTIWSFYCVWYFYVLGFGLFSPWIKFDQVTWYAIFGIMTTLAVHTFYIERAYRLLHKQKWVVGIMIPPILTYCIGAIGAKIRTSNYTNGLNIAITLQPWFYTWLSGLFAADIMLTSLMTYGLYTCRTGWSDTDRLVSRLIKMTFETQLPATIFAVIYLIYYCLQPVSLIVAALEIAHVKIYAVSMMAVLNSRMSMWKEENTQFSVKKQRKHSVQLSDDHVEAVEMLPHSTRSI